MDDSPGKYPFFHIRKSVCLEYFVLQYLGEPIVNLAASHPTARHPHLLHKWLQSCDENHTECRQRLGKENFWPTRVIFVGDLNKLALIEEPLHGEDYLALSHCWGVPTEEEKDYFCTTTRNYESRLQGFSYNELPKTFQHAVQVTRALQKQYLWIDALCIIQGDNGDWETQAKTMADIFACAYCTIAADSAHGWGDGFLNQIGQHYGRHLVAVGPGTPRPIRRYGDVSTMSTKEFKVSNRHKPIHL